MEYISRLILGVFFALIPTYFIVDYNFYRTVDCTVVSAEATSGGGAFGLLLPGRVLIPRLRSAG